MFGRLNHWETPAVATAADRNKARIYSHICAWPEVTRKQIASDLKIRPATVSVLVADLLEHRLVREGEPVVENRKGRREIPLTPVSDRFAAIVVHVVSNTVRATLVDMAGSVRAERRFEQPIDSMAGNADLEALFASLVEELRPCVTPGMDLEGIVLALPGLVDERSGVWIFSSRWPRMREMTFEELGRRSGLKVLVSKNLNVELERYLAVHPEAGEGGTLFVHWGFGIGAAYAHDGQILRPHGGGFGELGHWLGGGQTDRQCLCGKRGCLETEAALWAILPEIRHAYPDAPGDEWAFEDFLARMDLAKCSVIRRATERFVTALHDLQMVLFARTIVVTGPFVQDAGIFDRLRTGLLDLLPTYAKKDLKLVTARHMAADEIIGAAAPFFEAALRDHLNFPN
ncbi:MAG: ROK family protein [Rhodospirillales bacterium]|nr:ROK family protein [Rhodospirillales bacterium]